MAKRRGYGPQKPNVTPKKEVTLDRFGAALIGSLIDSSHYTDNIPGLPVKISSNAGAVVENTATRYARQALMTGYTGAHSHDGQDDTGKLYDAGARIIHLAQCVKEAGLCQEYLEYTPLPADNNSGLFGADTPSWPGAGSRYNGDLKDIYNTVVSSLPYTEPMFSMDDLDQFQNNPLIPNRLAYYIKAFMDECYGAPDPESRIRTYGEFLNNG